MDINHSAYRFVKIFAGCILLCLLFSLVTQCKKPYNPTPIKAASSYLVVEGVINSGNDSTIIKITRTTGLSTTVPDSEDNAQVTVENDQNGSFPLNEKSKGIYISAPLNINRAQQYRLRIKTADNNVYLSDFAPVQTTPPIDSVGFTIQPNGLLVYVNTHDATNSVQYYRWDYTETWQFHSVFNSQFVVVGNAIVGRTALNQIYDCFGNDASSDIPLAEVSDLKQDVLNQAPITVVPSTSEKIETRYSILVKQYALTGDAYNFYSKLKKNTEQLGGIFDAQPSELQGNIHCITNAPLPVIGYISANNITSKRIFISNSQLPAWTYVPPYFCVENGPPLMFDIIGYAQTHPNTVYLTSSDTTLTTRQCADCTLRGTTKAPSFWIY